jgi:hypothetical protein
VASGKGRHVYFRMQAPASNRKLAVRGREVLAETRGQGGYIVAPPSVHPSGHVYRWVTTGDDSEPWAHPLPGWPVHALPLKRMRPERPVVVPFRANAGQGSADHGGPLAGLVRTVLNAQPGQRNVTLNWAAFRAGEHVARGRLDATTAASALLAAAAAIGLTEHEAIRTVGSGLGSAGAA